VEQQARTSLVTTVGCPRRKVSRAPDLGLGMISLEGRRASYRASIVVQDSIA